MIAESLLYISLSLVPIEDFNPNKKFYLFIFVLIPIQTVRSTPYKNSFVDGPIVRWVVMGQFLHVIVY